MKKLFLLSLFCGSLIITKAQTKLNGGTSGTSLNKQTILINKRWHCDSYKKGTAIVALKPTDFNLLNADGSFDQVVLNVYAKGTWSFDNATNKLTIKNGGTFIWTVTELSDSTLKFNNGIEFYEMKKMKDFAVNTSASAKMKELGVRWKIKEQKKGGVAINYKATDFIWFHTDGTYEQVLMGIYAKGTWSFNGGETIVTVNNGGAYPWTVSTWSPSTTGVQFKSGVSDTLWLIKY